MREQLPRPVEVQHEDRWYRGWVEAYRYEDGRWRAFVRYTVEPGLQFLQWLDEAQVRPAGGRASGRGDI